MKRKFAFGAEKVVVESNYLNGSIWKCFENSTPVDAPFPTLKQLFRLREQMEIFFFAKAILRVCHSMYVFNLASRPFGTSQRVACSNNWDKH